MLFLFTPTLEGPTLSKLLLQKLSDAITIWESKNGFQIAFNSACTASESSLQLYLYKIEAPRSPWCNDGSILGTEIISSTGPSCPPKLTQFPSASFGSEGASQNFMPLTHSVSEPNVSLKLGHHSPAGFRLLLGGEGRQGTSSVYVHISTTAKGCWTSFNNTVMFNVYYQHGCSSAQAQQCYVLQANQAATLCSVLLYRRL